AQASTKMLLDLSRETAWACGTSRAKRQLFRSLRQADPPDEFAKPRVRMQALQVWFHLDMYDIAIAFRVGLFKRSERLLFVAQAFVDYGNVVRRDILLL